MASTNFSPGTVVQSSWLNDVNTVTYSTLSAVAGTNAITATGPATFVAYQPGVILKFLPANANTGATTVNFNGIGVVNLTKYGTSPLVAGDLAVGSWAYVSYDGTRFQLLNPQIVDIAHGGTGATTASQALINLGGSGRLVNVQVFTANGTYTPTAGTTSIVVAAVGGGGGGGGTVATGGATAAAAGGGGGGAYGVGRFTSAFAGLPVTIGTAGGGGLAGPGGAGGTTSLGALITAPGGGGGGVGNPVTPAAVTAGQTGGVGLATGANITSSPGGVSGVAMILGLAQISGGFGGTSPYGVGGRSNINASAPGENGTGRGSGGAGGTAGSSTAAQLGGNGTAGVLIIYEFA